MSEFPTQNPPINEASNKGLDKLYICVIGGLATIILGGLGYYFNNLDNRINAIDKKYQEDHVKLMILDSFKTSISQDHDKITVLENDVKTLMKHIEPKAK